MKKQILALLLSTLLVANICACIHVAKNDFESNSKMESSTLNNTFSLPMENESNNNLSNQEETVRDVPELGQLKLFSSRNLETASIWTDYKGEFYIYFNEWDAYRHLRELSSYHSLYFSPYRYESDNNIVVDGETATVSIIDQYGKHDEPTIITYHFNRSNELVELHAVPLNIKASSEYDLFFINMHDADHGYYFLTPHMDGDMDGRKKGEKGWSLFMFETTDGGKSWNQISTNTFDRYTKYIEILKFVSPSVGISSFRERDEKELWERTYLTVDGGLTWTQMPQLPHGDIVEWYSEIIDLEYMEDHGYYRLKVEACNYTTFQVQLWSKDLINWTIIET